jgi:Resolvase, N terminal domain
MVHAVTAIDIVVVYKIDRLSRSMLDFLKLVESFEYHGVTFVFERYRTLTDVPRVHWPRPFGLSLAHWRLTLGTALPPQLQAPATS